MVSVMLFCVVLFLLLRVPNSSANEEILVLTNDNWKETLHNNDAVVVEFVIDSPHSLFLAPVFPRVVRQVEHKLLRDGSTNRVVFGQVNCTEEELICTQDSELKFFPTTKVFWKETTVDDTLPAEDLAIGEDSIGAADDEISSAQAPGEFYSVAFLTEFVYKYVKPSFSILRSLDDFQERAKSDDVFFTGLFDTEDCTEAIIYKSVAEILSFNYTFLISFDPEVASGLGVSGNGLVAAGKYWGKNPLKFRKDWKLSSVSDFIQKSAFPPVSELSLQSFELIHRKGLPVLFALLDDNPGSSSNQKIIQLLRQLGARNFEDFSVVYGESSKLSRLRLYLGGEKDAVPSFYLFSYKIYEKAQFPTSQKPTLEALQNFLNSWKDGSIVKVFKSDPIPPPRQEGTELQRIVGSQFQELVLEAHDQDVMLTFDCEWCGLKCFEAEKLLLEAEAFQSKPEAVGNIAFYKMDAIGNDVPIPFFWVPTFPMIILFPRDNKTDMTLFESEFTFQRMSQFLSQKCDSIAEALEQEKVKDPEQESLDQYLKEHQEKKEEEKRVKEQQYQVEINPLDASTTAVPVDLNANSSSSIKDEL